MQRCPRELWLLLALNNISLTARLVSGKVQGVTTLIPFPSFQFYSQVTLKSCDGT